MLSKIKKYYFDRFNISLIEAERRALIKNENGIITAATEMVGETILKRYSLIDYYFPENIGWKKEQRVKYQRAGTDYIVFLKDDSEVYIDLKVNIGPDYYLKKEDLLDERVCINTLSVPIELKQNGVESNIKGKLTDYLLYIICQSDDIYSAILPYDEIVKICRNEKSETKYRHYISNNGSGEYIKYPITKYKKR